MLFRYAQGNRYFSSNLSQEKLVIPCNRNGHDTFFHQCAADAVADGEGLFLGCMDFYWYRWYQHNSFSRT